jgi:HEPN domain-containing protein
MTSDRIARDYLRRAAGRRQALDTLLASGLHADVVRESQDVVELILKGALRFVGVDPPKRHDVHDVVARYIDRFPADWRLVLAELREALDRLSEDRAPAFYGDEEEGIPASDLFRPEDAQQAIAVVSRLLDLYTRLLGEGR